MLASAKALPAESLKIMMPSACSPCGCLRAAPSVLLRFRAVGVELGESSEGHRGNWTSCPYAHSKMSLDRYPFRLESLLSIPPLLADGIGAERSPSGALPSLLKGSYLVDPASSHMLVSKIKPCMSKYKLLIL